MGVIYLIKELFINFESIKENSAYQYEDIGYVTTAEEAEEIKRLSKQYDVNDCWAIKGTIPQYTITTIPKININDVGEFI